MLSASGLGPKGKEMTFDRYVLDHNNTHAYTVARSWEPNLSMKEASKGLVLYGPNGVGKTHLACSIANRLIANGVFAKFLPTIRIPKHDTEAVLTLTDRDDVPVLVLDDLGAEKLTDRALECIYILINERLWNMAPLIVTTNFDRHTLMARLETESINGYGHKVVSRLSEVCEFIAVGGSDYREKL